MRRPTPTSARSSSAPGDFGVVGHAQRDVVSRDFAYTYVSRHRLHQWCRFGLAGAVGSRGFVRGLVVAAGIGDQFSDECGAAVDDDVVAIADDVAVVSGPSQ